MKLGEAKSAEVLVVTMLLGSVLPAGANAASEEEKIAADLANPLAPITTLSMQYRVELGNGPENKVNHQLRVQPSFFKPFADKSAFLMRTVIPVSSRRYPVDQGGLGDITLVPYYVPDTTQPSFVGYGAALGLPTANGDALGSGKWTAGPAILFAKPGQLFTYGGLAQHIWSVAGDDKRPDVSVSTLQPFVTYLLGGGWSTTVISEMSYNWKGTQDRWTIPVNVGVSRVLSVGGQFVNLGVTGVRYVTRSDWLPEWEVRATATYVFRSQ